MTSGPTFWAIVRWWKRCWAVCGTTATPCTLTGRRCARHKVETSDRGRRTRRVHSPGSGGVPQNAGNDGNRPPCGPHAGHATLPTRSGRECSRKRIRAGGGAPPDASRRCPAVGHDSLAGLFPAGDRGSARHACQPGVLPARTPQTPTDRSGRVAAESFSNQLPTRAFGADDGNARRTPAAWIILLSLSRSSRHAFGVDESPPISLLSPVPFSAWVTSAHLYWSTLAKRRSSPRRL